MRVLHVVAHFDLAEAHGRALSDIAATVPGEHAVVTSGKSGGVTNLEVFDIGGSAATLTLRHSSINAAARRFGADVIHLHAGPVGVWSYCAHTPLEPAVGLVCSMYAWPHPSLSTFTGPVPPMSALRSPTGRPLAWMSRALRPATVARALNRHDAHVVSADPSIIDRLTAHGAQCHQVVGTVPPQPVRRTRQRRPHFVFSGRAEMTRGVLVFIDAISEMRRRGQEVDATVALLAGCDMDRIAAHAEATGVYATIGPTDVRKLYRAATAWVLPFVDGAATLTPNAAAAEALAAGVPVVGGDVSCINAVVAHGTDGLLVPPNDVSALVSALTEIADNPELADTMSANALCNTTRRWNDSNMVAAVQAAYEQSTHTNNPTSSRK